MRKFFSKLFGKDKETSDSYRYEDNNSAIKRYVRRLYELENELELIGSVFSEDAEIIQTKVNESKDPSEVMEDSVATINKLRVPGYCAYKLAEEGLVLIQLLSVKMGVLKNSKTLTEDEKIYVSNFEGIVKHFNETGEQFHLTLENMRPYKTLKGEDILKHFIQQSLSKYQNKDS